MSLQLSSEQSVGDVWIAQLDRKRVPQARSSGCKSSVAVTAECSWHHASRNVSWPQRAPSAVGHEAVVTCSQARVKFYWTRWTTQLQPRCTLRFSSCPSFLSLFYWMLNTDYAIILTASKSGGQSNIVPYILIHWSSDQRSAAPLAIAPFQSPLRAPGTVFRHLQQRRNLCRLFGRDWRLNCFRDRARPAISRDSICCNVTFKFFFILRHDNGTSFTN